MWRQASKWAKLSLLLLLKQDLISTACPGPSGLLFLTLFPTCHVPCVQHKHIVRTVSFARGDATWQLCTGGAEKLLRIFDLQRPDAAPTGAHSQQACTACPYACAWLL